MKTLVIAVAVLGSSLFNSSFASNTPTLDGELKKVVKFENNKLPITKDQTEFVKVSFKINASGQIEILEMNYSDEQIKSQLVEKLTEITLEQNFDNKKVYNYNFTFEKR